MKGRAKKDDSGRVKEERGGGKINSRGCAGQEEGWVEAE